MGAYMSYQALFFYRDEKTARLLMQVLDELDFSVEPEAEPFAAVRTLMLQRFDIIVVDCEDEQNATLLFKSARNSETNRDALVAAITMSQSSIANAFRMGASLILTRPLNLEQAKGTLRMARSELRKAEAQKATPPVRAHAHAAAAGPGTDSDALLFPSDRAPHSVIEPEPAADIPEAVASAALAAAPAVEEPAGVQVGEIGETVSEPRETPDWIPVGPIGQMSVSEPRLSSNGVEVDEEESAPPLQGVAIVPVPVPEATEPDNPLQKSPTEPESEDPTLKDKDAEEKVAATAKPAASTATIPAAIPTRFASLGIKEKKEKEEDDNFDPGKSTKNFWIAAVLVLSLAGAGYYAWIRLHPSIKVPYLSKVQSQALSARSGSPAPPPKPAAPLATAASDQAAPTSDASSTPASAADAASSTLAPPKSAGDTPKADTSKSVIPPQQKASTSDSGMAVLSEDVSQALVTRKVQPVYPEEARQARIEGVVRLQVNINPGGTVAGVEVLGGNAILAKAAIAAVRQWKYQSYYVNGRPAPIQTQVTLDFRLP